MHGIFHVGIAMWRPGAIGNALEGHAAAAVLAACLFLAAAAAVPLVLIAARRRRAWAALRHRNARLELALDAGRVGTWEWSAVRGEIQVSARYAPLFGGGDGSGPIACDRFRARAHPDDVVRFLGHVATLAEGSANRFVCELRMRHHEGEWHWLTMHGARLAGPAGDATVFGTVVDVTSHKRADEELKGHLADQEIIAALLRLSLMPIPLDEVFVRALPLVLTRPGLDLSPQGSIFVADPTAATLTMKAREGLEPDLVASCAIVPFGHCLCGRAAAAGEIVHAGAIDHRHDIAFEGMRPHGHYCVPLKSDGEVLGVLNLYVPAGHARDERGDRFVTTVADTLAGIIRRKRAEDLLERTNDMLEERVRARTLGLEREVAERKAAELALRESEERYRSIIGSTAEGYWRTDPDSGATLEVNDALCRMLGRPREEIVGRTPMDFMEDGVRTTITEKWSTILAAGQWDGEIVFRTRAGRDVNTVVKVTSIGDSAGRPATVFGFLSDMTARVEAERQVAEARDQANAANRAKSEFLSRMSHELRTPMNAILGFAQLLECDPVAPLRDRQMDYLQQILKGGRHLLDLINEVLDLARIESSRLALSIEPFAPHEVLDECLTLAEAIARPRGIAVETRFGAVPDVRADRTRLKQCVINLLSNAVKYNRENGRILAEAVPMEDMLRIRVTDTGNGIPPHLQGDLFKPFNRLGAETTEIEGTGIGLTITRYLVEAMGGRIDFSSIEGQGSAFWIDVPIAAEGGPADEAPPPSEPRAAALFPPSASTGEPAGTLLYIEDNPASVALMEGVVRHLPRVTLVCAHTAELGLQLAAAHGPNLVVLDLNLPGMSGLDALQRLRAEGMTAPIVALTADATTATRERAMAVGFSAYLTKPVRVTELLRTVKHEWNAKP